MRQFYLQEKGLPAAGVRRVESGLQTRHAPDFGPLRGYPRAHGAAEDARRRHGTGNPGPVLRLPFCDRSHSFPPRCVRGRNGRRGRRLTHFPRVFLDDRSTGSDPRRRTTRAGSLDRRARLCIAASLPGAAAPRSASDDLVSRRSLFGATFARTILAASACRSGSPTPLAASAAVTPDTSDP